jgi:putative heme-binding domain-containing protein
MPDNSSRRPARARLICSIVVFAAGGVHTQQAPADDTENRPIAVWAAGPLDVVAAFDRPISQAQAASLVGRSIPYFEPDPRSDRSASSAPAGALRIAGSRLADDGRTLLLATDPHPRPARYLLPLPAREPAGVAALPAPGEATYDLTGVEANWSQEGDAGDEPRWSVWWPLLDFEAARRLTQESRRHQHGLALFTRPGRLVLSTLLRLPAGTVTIRIDASGPIEDTTLGEIQAEPSAPPGRDGLHHIDVSTASKGEPLFLTLSVRTGENSRPFALKATMRGDQEKAPRALKRDQLLLPWVPLPAASETGAPVVVPDLSGGDAARGQALFSGDQARCAQCHVFRGTGGKVGPDLTAIAEKGRAEIYRSIAAPSIAIDPDYTTYTVATKDGQISAGVVRAEGADAIRVTDTNAHDTLVLRTKIQQIRPSATSIMPAGLAGALGDAAVRDIIAFLTSNEPAKPAQKSEKARPTPPRS